MLLWRCLAILFFPGGLPFRAGLFIVVCSTLSRCPRVLRMSCSGMVRSLVYLRSEGGSAAREAAAATFSISSRPRTAGIYPQHGSFDGGHHEANPFTAVHTSVFCVEHVFVFCISSWKHLSVILVLVCSIRFVTHLRKRRVQIDTASLEFGSPLVLVLVCSFPKVTSSAPYRRASKVSRLHV